MSDGYRSIFRIEGIPDDLPDGTYPSRLKDGPEDAPWALIVEYAPDKTLEDSLIKIVVNRQQAKVALSDE